MKPLFIIPARGGSKGIPGKNIKPLGGKPLIAHTVAHALAVAPAASIVVTTDSEAIADAARSAGATLICMRPASLATDTAGSREVMLHAMDWASDRGVDFDTAVLLQPTSPLRTPGDIVACMDAYKRAQPQADMAVTVTPSPANPYYDCFETDADGRLRISKGDGLYTRRQDAPQAWVYNGAVYVIKPESLRAMPLGAMPCRVPCEMPRSRSIDLDTPTDWLIAEALVKQ